MGTSNLARCQCSQKCAWAVDFHLGRGNIGGADRALHVGVASCPFRDAVGSRYCPRSWDGAVRGDLGVCHFDYVDKFARAQLLQASQGDGHSHSVSGMRHVDQPSLSSYDAGRFLCGKARWNSLRKEKADELTFSHPHLLADDHGVAEHGVQGEGAVYGQVVRDCDVVQFRLQERLHVVIEGGGRISGTVGVGVQVYAQLGRLRCR